MTIAILTVALALAAIEENTVTHSAPHAVVERYCALDVQGARLQSDTWDQIADLISWRVEPGWDTAYVVTRVHVSEATIDGDSASVEVAYRIVRVLTGGQLYEPSDPSFANLVRQNARVVFRLTRSTDRWTITSPQINPHVGLIAATRNTQELLSTERSDEHRDTGQIENLEQTLRGLRKLAERYGNTTVGD